MNTLKDYVNFKLTHADKVAEAEGYPLTMQNCKKYKKVKDLKVYGDSFQDGTPTPDNPIEVRSVGELVTDKSDGNYGKYKIPVVQRGLHIVNPMGFVGGSLSYNTDDDTYTMEWGSSRFSNSCMQASSIPVGSRIYIDVKWIDDNLNKKQFGVMLVYKDGTIAYSAIEKTHYFNFNFTITKPLYYISLYFNNSDEVQGCWVTFKDLIVCYRDEFTEYEPYVEPVTTNIYLNQPLRKVGNYTDYIDFKNNKVVRNIGVGTSNSLSIWREQSNNYNCGITWGLPNCNYRANIALCTHLEYLLASNGVYFNFIDGIYWFFDKTLFPTKADADSWIANRKADEIPLRFHYVFTTPTEEPLSLDLPKLNAKTSIIEVDTSLAPSNAYGKYIKK